MVTWDSKGLLKGMQHGFRKGRSCLTNLLVFLDRVTKELDNGGSMDVKYLDSAKAFDMVLHQRLLRKREGFPKDCMEFRVGCWHG